MPPFILIPPMCREVVQSEIDPPDMPITLTSDIDIIRDGCAVEEINIIVGDLYIDEEIGC
jgi:hypothetical protein